MDQLRDLLTLRRDQLLAEIAEAEARLKEVEFLLATAFRPAVTIVTARSPRSIKKDQAP